MSVETDSPLGAETSEARVSVVDAVMKTHRSWSPIWLLPILALAIGIWLIWQSWLNQGLTVYISFPTGEGMAAGETKVRYKGIPVGVVKRLSAQKEKDRVLAEVLFQPDFARFELPADTEFWLVQPQISLQGVSGLSTLLTGNYLAIALGTSEETAHVFDARTGAPPLNGNTPGLHIRLRSEQLASVNVGSPVFYREIAIGSVQAFALAADQRGVIIDVNIVPEHAGLVRKNSRFWNASGVQVNAGLSGVNIRTGSLMSILFGGIAMASDEQTELDQSTVAGNGDEFALYADYDAARAGLPVTIRFASADGLQPGSTRVMYKGVEVGKLRDVQMQPGKAEVSAQFGLDPRLARYITERTRFWLVRPSLSAGVDSLLKGGYVTFSANDGGKAARDFVAHNGPDLFDFEAPGLHLLLKAETLNGLAVGAPVFYRELQVGSVQSAALNTKTGKSKAGDSQPAGLFVHVLIDPEYAGLVSAGSRFWNSGGVKLKADLSGVDVQTGPLLSMLGGGISFATPLDSESGATALSNGQQFVLFGDERSASLVATASLKFASAQGLQAGQTKVWHRGREVGRVEKLVADGNGVRAEVGFDAEGAALLREGTQFWLQEASLSAGGSLSELLAGASIQVKPGQGAAKTEFVASRHPPAEGSGEPGLNLVLLTSDASGISIGAPLLYKQLTVGRVFDVSLSADGRRVQVMVHIDPEHAARVSTATRFWLAGGVQVQAGLQGLAVKAGRLDALWHGGIAFADTDDAESGKSGVSATKPAHSGDQFVLYRDSQAASLDGITIAVQAPIETGLTVGSLVRQHGQVVGEVAAIHSDASAGTSLLSLRLLPALSQQLGAGAKLWLVKPALGLARTANLDALSGVYIGLSASPGPVQTLYRLALNEPIRNRREGGLNLSLSAARLGSVHAGDPVLYRQIKVGEVLGAELDNADKVRIFIAIEPRYAPLVRRSSRFWRASGIAVDAGLFSGVQVQTESLETIVAGGIAFATPEDHDTELARDGEGFALADRADDDWLEWAPQIRLPPE